MQNFALGGNLSTLRAHYGESRAAVKAKMELPADSRAGNWDTVKPPFQGASAFVSLSRTSLATMSLGKRTEVTATTHTQSSCLCLGLTVADHKHVGHLRSCAARILAFIRSLRASTSTRRRCCFSAAATSWARTWRSAMGITTAWVGDNQSGKAPRIPQ